jgi:hypothetical protein
LYQFAGDASVPSVSQYLPISAVLPQFVVNANKSWVKLRGQNQQDNLEHWTDFWFHIMRIGYWDKPFKEALEMSQLRILICRVDNNDENKMTEIASFAVAERDVSSLQAETALDEIENDTHQVGQQFLRRLLQAQWEEIDKQLVEVHRQRFSP